MIGDVSIYLISFVYSIKSCSCKCFFLIKCSTMRGSHLNHFVKKKNAMHCEMLNNANNSSLSLELLWILLDPTDTKSNLYLHMLANPWLLFLVIPGQFYQHTNSNGLDHTVPWRNYHQAYNEVQRNLVSRYWRCPGIVSGMLLLDL